MISYNFNGETRILEVKFEGKIDIKELTNYIITIREDESLPKYLKIFSDATNGKFAHKVNRGDLKRFFKENRFTLESKQKEFIFDAFVVSSSMEMALGMIYREIVKINNYKFNIFSTREAAMNWLSNY